MEKKGFLFITFILLSFLLIACSPEDVSNAEDIVSEGGIDKEAPEGENAEQESAMTFIVNVPENTPAGDIINIMYNIPTPDAKYPFDTLEVPMEQIGPYRHKISLSREELALEEGWDAVEYKYNRNAWDDITSEYLPLKPEDKEPGNPFEYRNAKRQADFAPGKVIEDTVERWRWFPYGDVKETSDIEQSGNFLPRVNNVEFRSGQGIQDLSIDGFDKFFDSTAAHMADMGYRWAAVYPPWQWYQDDPPRVGNAAELGIRDDPNYPDDDKLKEQIMAFKKAGLKVSMEQQICCTSIGTQNRDSVWWGMYADEVERFLVHHAKLAEDVGAASFIFDTFGIDSEKTPDYGQRIDKMLNEVRKAYTGDIMIPISPFLYQVEAAENTIPSVDEVPWAANADAFLYLAEGELSPKDAPSDKELAAGAKRNLDLMKPFYDKYNKPVVVRIAPFSIKHAWKGPSFYSKGKVPGESGAEDDWQFHSFSNEDQARVVNAYWQAAAERPWVIGLFNFGYWHWDMPMLPDWSIRGKPAEDIWRKWNEVVYEE